jgi:hypothetical protein
LSRKTRLVVPSWRLKRHDPDPQWHIDYLDKVTMSTQCTTVVVVAIPARSNLESAMSDAQFDQLLDAVRTALEPTTEGWHPPDDLLIAANDNHLAWPLVPFPKGWYAAS